MLCSALGRSGKRLESSNPSPIPKWDWNGHLCMHVCLHVHNPAAPPNTPKMLVLSQGLKLQVFEEKSLLKRVILNFQVSMSICLSESANIGIEAVKAFK